MDETTYVYMENGVAVQTDAAGARQRALEAYEVMGGADFFHRLAKAFYQLVAQDDLIGPLFPGNWDEQARRLARHFIRMYGRPDLSEAWNPKFLRAHLNVVIGQRHRVRWIALMAKAGEAVSAPQPWFEDFMLVMLMSASVEVTGISRGAAMARGLEMDEEGEIEPAPARKEPSPAT